MPSRWFVPVVGLDPVRVRLEHVHAAFSGWFDDNLAEHRANEKPYVVSPPTLVGNKVGVEIAVLTEHAEDRLRLRAGQAQTVRLGNQLRQLGPMHLLQSESWNELELCRGVNNWRLELMTPTTFRTGDRSSPLPTVHTVLGGLERSWTTWCGPRAPVSPETRASVWVSDLDLRSTPVSLRVRGRDGSARSIVLCGSTGSLVFRCVDAAAAEWAGPLFRLAAYSGVGSMRGKGFGVVRVTPEGARPAGTAGDVDRKHGTAG